MINPKNFRPLHDRLLVRKLADLPAKGQRILAPEIAADDKLIFRGEILAAGPGKFKRDGTRRQLDVKVGDIIYFGEHNDFEQQGLVMLTEGDVRGVEKK